MKTKVSLILFALLWTSHAAVAQQDRTSVINIKVSRSVKAVTYRAKTETRIDFAGTPLMPRAEGKAKVVSKDGNIRVETEFSKLVPATTLGPAYLTYVLWAITPEGRASNLGEVILDGSTAKLTVTTRLQAFALIVTSEPYFAVSSPSEMVVIENKVRDDTKGQVGIVDAKLDLLTRGNYEGAEIEEVVIDPKTPLELYQARNAVRIAKWQQADRLATDSYEKAGRALAQAEDYQLRKQYKPVIAAAREAVQIAEDARSIAVKRAIEENLARERAEAERREAQAKAEADAEARRRAEADAQRKTAEEAQRRAEIERLQAEKEKADAERRRMEAEVDKMRAEAEQKAALDRERLATEDAQRARESAEKAEREKQELRNQLLEQLNRILPTTDTPRGLKLTMADILFDTGLYNLRGPAREALARLSGIVLSHPGLRLEVEGHTDDVGGEESNQRLSEKRAESVSQLLVSNGLGADSITARGFGETIPIDDNKTQKGRQQNRRVEIIVSGEVIGTKIK